MRWWTTRIAAARVMVADRLTRGVLGPLAGGLPATGVRTLEELRFRPEVEAHVAAAVVLRPPTVVTYDLPPGLAPSFRRRKAFEERHLYRLRDVVVSPRSGLAWLPQGPVLEESVGDLRRLLWWGGHRAELLLPRRRLDVPGPLLAVPPAPFFHWLLEILPGVITTLRAHPDARPLLPPDPPAYVRDGLRLLRRAGLLHAPAVVVDAPVRVRDLLVPGVERDSGFVHPDDQAELRAALLPLVDPTRPTPERLYVSRRRAAARRLEDEAALEAGLRDAGLEIQHNEDLDLATQIQRFARATTVVAPHGAGLAPLVFARPGCRVVELFPPTVGNDCYARLAVERGATYTPLVAEGDLATLLRRIRAALG